LSQKSGIKRFLERLIDCRAIKAHRTSIVRQQSDQNRFGEVVVFSQILTNLQRFDFAD